MITGILSGALTFLSGSAFRMIWGEVSSYIDKRQDHKHEMERIKAQAEIDATAHLRNMQQLKLQSELGIKEITVRAEAAVDEKEADAWLAAMANADRPSGVAWVDGWNKSIRPAAATIVLALWVSTLSVRDFVVTPWDLELMGAVLGFFFADRSLGRRGK